MFFFGLLATFGAAIAAVSLLDNDSDSHSTEGEFEKDIEEEAESEHLDAGNVNLLDLVDVASPNSPDMPFEEISGRNNIPDNESAQRIDITSIDQPIYEGVTDPVPFSSDVVDDPAVCPDAENLSTNREVVSIEDVEALPTPLSDWSLGSSVATINGGTDSEIDLAFPDDASGSLHVLSAPYQELQSNEPFSSVRVHTGQNIYFVPQGEQFPEDYSWSEEGGFLYRNDGEPDDENDFGRIKLVARIDNGTIGYQTEDTGDVRVTFDDRVGSPILTSNLSIQMGSFA